MTSRKSYSRRINTADHKQLTQLLRHLGMIAEQADNGIVLINLHGIIHFVNSAWARMHGCQNSTELLGKSISQFHTPEQMKKQIAPLLREAKHRGQFRQAVDHLRSDGTSFHTETKVTAVRDGRTNCVALIISVADTAQPEHDGKELQQQIAELTATNEKLEHQITIQQQAEEDFQQQITELTEVNERLRNQINEYQQPEQYPDESPHDSPPAPEQLQNANAENAPESQMPHEDSDHSHDAIDLSRVWDMNKLKSVSDLAKKLR